MRRRLKLDINRGRLYTLEGKRCDIRGTPLRLGNHRPFDRPRPDGSGGMVPHSGALIDVDTFKNAGGFIIETRENIGERFFTVNQNGFLTDVDQDNTDAVIQGSLWRSKGGVHAGTGLVKHNPNLETREEENQIVCRRYYINPHTRRLHLNTGERCDLYGRYLLDMKSSPATYISLDLVSTSTGIKAHSEWIRDQQRAGMRYFYINPKRGAVRPYRNPVIGMEENPFWITLEVDSLLEEERAPASKMYICPRGHLYGEDLRRCNMDGSHYYRGTLKTYTYDPSELREFEVKENFPPPLSDERAIFRLAQMWDNRTVTQIQRVKSILFQLQQLYPVCKTSAPAWRTSRSEWTQIKDMNASHVLYTLAKDMREEINIEDRVPGAKSTMLEHAVGFLS